MSSADQKSMPQIIRIVVCLLTMGFIFPNALIEESSSARTSTQEERVKK